MQDSIIGFVSSVTAPESAPSRLIHSVLAVITELRKWFVQPTLGTKPFGRLTHSTSATNKTPNSTIGFVPQNRPTIPLVNRPLPAAGLQPPRVLERLPRFREVRRKADRFRQFGDRFVQFSLAGEGHAEVV